MSLHHPRLVHCAPANDGSAGVKGQSAMPNAVLTVRYVSLEAALDACAGGAGHNDDARIMMVADGCDRGLKHEGGIEVVTGPAPGEDLCDEVLALHARHRRTLGYRDGDA